MTEEVLAVIIPGKILSNNQDRSGQIDLLFEAKDDIVVNIKNDDEFMKFKENINKYVFDKIEGEMQYHLDTIIAYLKKYFKKEIGTLNFDIYEPATAFALYKILARFGFIVMINSQYNIPIFLPSIENVLKCQIEALQRIDTLIDPTISIAASFGEEEEYFYTFNDLIEFVKIKKGIKYE